MTYFKIEYLDDLPVKLGEEIHRGHITNESMHGVICNYKMFYLVIVDNTSKVMGALTAYTAYSEIYVDDIWVNPNFRKKGLGRKLLEYLESHFQGKGYNNINLVTSQFQAPDFYKKCGFKIEFIRKNKCNPKLTKYFFIKYFDDKHQHQGILDRDQEFIGENYDL
jgi:ribosomal protein S18 acetylase RimI-like enzyme